MFAKISTVLIALAAVAVAIPTPGGVSQCNTGSAQCCNSVQSAGSEGVSTLLGLLGVVVQDATVQVGLNCLPILSGGECNAEPVCCENNNYNGLINIGCSPITL